ncbi:PREDICTED: LOW QUALITY PROTEIN: pseudouridylate synthase-like 1 [Lipotes vexillifer]|uniref:tRNA pseudouridine synthase-like 1 n=1 Tax=Lipotes vexillifer TaxID=118797 RepID=A0A340YH77_LIPVE|nr:PREDICTED: LOW QUALITY PROTEIN: pseudouridylate synthase-like 1 [Lipotes vexillifer]
MAAAARGAHWHEDGGAPSGIPCRPARLRRAAPRRARRPPAPERGRSATAPPRLSPPGSVAKVRRPPSTPAVTAGERRQTPRRPAPFVRAGGRKCGWAQQQPREPSGPARSSDPAVSLAPPPPPPWEADRGCLGGAKAQAQARERPGGVTKLGSRARAGTRRRSPTCRPSPPGAPRGPVPWPSACPDAGSGLAMGAGSVRARYLVYFQYLGTDFNGVAAVRGAQHAIGVQNYLEEAAERLNSVVPVKFTISSRTDAGVHALSNAAHLDVQRRSGWPPFSPEVLTQALNSHLRHPAIRVLQAFRVPSHFHARHAATSRTYLYRLVTGCRRPDQLPVFERNRCWALRADCLDVAAMREAAQHLLGTHDFRAFQSAGSPATSPVRTLRRASVSPDPASSPFVLPEESRRLRFWSLEFESQSFLYRQVRRMTSVLVAVGLGALMPAQVKVILESQDPLGRHQSRVAPAHGLFLKAVLYEGFGKRRRGEIPCLYPEVPACSGLAPAETVTPPG